MKALVLMGLVSLALIGLATPVKAEYRFEIAHGVILLHPQGNQDFGSERGIATGDAYHLTLQSGESYRRTTEIGFGFTYYPFATTYYSSLPCVVGAGRPGEYGTGSYRLSVDLDWVWCAKRNEQLHLLPLTPRFGLMVGCSLYRDGARHWHQYDYDADPETPPWHEVGYSAYWKTPFVTTGFKLGFEMLRLGSVSFNADLQNQVKLNMYPKSHILEWLETGLMFSTNFGL